MRQVPAHLTWLQGAPLVAVLDAESVVAASEAYELDGEVELVDLDREPACDMPDMLWPETVVLIAPGGGHSSGAGTGMPWEQAYWYARPRIVGVWMTRSGPETGCYAPCKVRLKVAEDDRRPRTWWGYAGGL